MGKEPTYRQALTYGWSTVWHNKSLWILGLFAVLVGQFGFSDIMGQVWSMADATMMGEGFFLLPVISLSWPADVWSVLGAVWLFGICIIFLILLVFLAITSQGALISYVAEWFKTKKHQKLSKPWNNGLKHFWSVLLVNILRKILLVLLLSVFGLSLSYFFYSRTLPQSIIFAIGLALALFVSLFISVISIFALCYVVVDDKGVKSALKKSWLLFSKHLLVSVEAGLILMLLNFLLLVVILAGAFFAFLPALLIWVAAGITNMMVLAAVGLALGIFLLLVFIVLAAGFFNAFTTSAWVFLFMKMHKEGVSSRTIHFFKHLFGK